MKTTLILLLLLHFSIVVCTAQDVPPVIEQDVDQEETDDSYLQQLEYFKKHPLDLNTADANALKEIIFLNDVEIMNLLAYRSEFGKLISIYELQAVPGWEIEKIKKILPYIMIGNALSFDEDMRQRIKKGEHTLMIRFSSQLEKIEPGYTGGKEKIFIRYKYRYKDLLQYGLSADKDAGEKIFDFYSFHFFAKKIGKIDAIAIGDFAVNMGQGLIEWQGSAFGKSMEVMSIKRQSPVLKPYSSSGEFYFHRGVGITVKYKTIESTVFLSLRKLSANLKENTVSSLLTSGYHRTASEMMDKNNLGEFAAGATIKLQKKNWHAAVNTVNYHYSLPFQKNDEAYNIYAINGKNWSNISVDYSYTIRNLHFFGEMAIDKNFSVAMINGLLISVDSRIDISFVQRKIAKEYQSVYGNAFTESTKPSNETGLYAGISIRFTSGLKLNAYADMYSFPWLKFATYAPGYGKDFSMQLNYSPNKQTEIYSRWRSQAKESDQFKMNWRTQFNFALSKSTTIRNRVEMVWYNKKQADAANGFLFFFDILHKPLLKPWSANLRLQYFEADDYDARVYAYENDVLYAFSIPAFFDKGYRFYLNFNYDLLKNISVWLKWAQTIYPDGNNRSEIKLEAFCNF